MKSEEIAKIAGVSRSTVSRVINNYSNVPEETRQKVMKVIEAYNYMPNSVARTLAGKRSNTIGLFFVVREGIKESERLFKNEYFTAYLELLVDMANAKNYYVLVNLVSEESEYIKVYRAFSEKRIDGGIIIGTQEDTLSRIHAENIESPLVVFDYELNAEEKELYKSANLSIINSRDEDGIFKAVNYLFGLGHRKIGFMKGILTSRAGKKRLLAYKNAMKIRGLSINENYYIDGSFQTHEAYKNMKKAIEKGDLPTAYICANDFMALGALTALKEANINVPGEISLIGFDNTHRSEEAEPRLSSFGPNYRDMAARAIQILDFKINGEFNVPEIVEYNVNFYERDSCIRNN